jgi:hypothetical protein
MLNDIKAPLAETRFSFESLTMISYQWSFDMFCMSLTVSELVTENRLNRYIDAPSRRKYFHLKARPRLPISAPLTLCVYPEPFSSYSRFFTRLLHESCD